MKKQFFPVVFLVLLGAFVALAATPPILPRGIVSTDRLPVVNTGTATAYTVSPDQIDAYSQSKHANEFKTVAAFNAYSAAQSVKLAAKLDDPSNNPDGTHRVNVRNSVARTYAPQEGDLDTDANGKIWLYYQGVWVEKASGYTLPIASASTLGGIKVGSNLSIDGNGVLSALAASGGGGSGMTVQPPFSGTQTVRVGNRYTASGASRLVFRNHSSGTFQMYAKAATTLVPDAAGSGIFWNNPTTFASYSSGRGYSVTVPAGTYVDLVSYGSGIFQAVMTTQNLARTGVNEYMVLACNNGVGALVNQNFEGTGFDNSETWTKTIGTNGTVNEDDTTATVLRGAQQLRIYAGDAGQVSYAKRDTGVNNSTLYVHFRYRTNSISPSSGAILAQLIDSGANPLAGITLNSGGTLKIAHGTGSATTTGTMAANTMYHLWFSYTAGAGNGTYSLAFSTTGTMPTSGANYVSGSNGTLTAAARSLWLEARYQLTEDFDQVIVSTTPIGDVCD